MPDLLEYLLPFALFGAFYPVAKAQGRRRGEFAGSFRGDVLTVVALLVAVCVTFVVLDAAGADGTVAYAGPFVVGLAVFFVLERATR